MMDTLYNGCGHTASAPNGRRTYGKVEEKVHMGTLSIYPTYISVRRRRDGEPRPQYVGGVHYVSMSAGALTHCCCWPHTPRLGGKSGHEWRHLVNVASKKCGHISGFFKQTSKDVAEDGVLFQPRGGRDGCSRFSSGVGIMERTIGMISTSVYL